MNPTIPQIALQLYFSGKMPSMMVLDLGSIKTGREGFYYLVNGKREGDNPYEYQAHVWCNRELTQSQVEVAARSYIQEFGGSWKTKQIEI